MTISVVRIDDRVIHGQTMTRWTKARPVDGILVVSDSVAHNQLRRPKRRGHEHYRSFRRHHGR